MTDLPTASCPAALRETVRLAGILLLGLILGDLGSALLPHGDEWASSRLLVSLVLAWSFVVFVQARRGYRAHGLFLGSGTVPWVAASVGLVGGFSLTLIGLSLASHLSAPLPQAAREISDRLSAGPRWPLLVASLLIAPVCEEAFFRGWLLSAWQPGHRRWTAVVAATVPFAVFHVFSWQVLLALPLGLLFGWLATTHRSLVPAIAAHFGANASPPLMEPILRALGHPAQAIQDMQSIPLSVTVLGLVLFVASLLTLSRARLPVLTPPPPSPR